MGIAVYKTTTGFTQNSHLCICLLESFVKSYTHFIKGEVLSSNVEKSTFFLIHAKYHTV